MGANKSIHGGKAKLDVGVNCSSHMLFIPLRISCNPFTLARGSLRLKHPNLFDNSDMLDHLVSPEVGIHGIPMNNFAHSASRDVRLSKLSIGMNMNEPSKSNWRNTTGIYFKHVHFRHDRSGRSISRDVDGFQLTRSGDPVENMLVINQEYRVEDANDRGFIHFKFQMEQGILPQNMQAFNRFEFFASKGVKLGPTFFSSWLTGGSIVGSIAPYQAFAIGGPNSVRGYGEGAVGSGRSCLVSQNELAIPLNKKLTGVIFLDCGSDLGSSHGVPGDPALRHGKPGTGLGIGYGIRFNTRFGQIKFDYAINAFQQRTASFGINAPIL